MDEALTRKEMEAVIAASEKVATNLTLIVERLSALNATQERVIAMQEKVMTRLQNGMTSEIVAAMKPMADSVTAIEKRQTWISWVMNCTASVVAFIGAARLYQIFIGKP